MGLSQSQKRKHAGAYVRSLVAREGGTDRITKERLAELTDRFGITVERQDGKKGDPLKSDYIRALGL